MTQELYQNAMKYAGEKHADQKVPGTNANYLLHISNVAMEVLIAYQIEQSFDIDYAIQVAILHDTIEDTNATYKEISEKFGVQIADGVLALTKDSTIESKYERMLDSLTRIKYMPTEVGIVKLADRITNLQKPPSHWSFDKIGKYAIEAKSILENLNGSNEYLENRLDEKINEYEDYSTKNVDAPEDITS